MRQNTFRKMLALGVRGASAASVSCLFAQLIGVHVKASCTNDKQLLSASTYCCTEDLRTVMQTSKENCRKMSFQKSARTITHMRIEPENS